MSDVSHHLDETGEPCTRHAPATPEAILGLALLGSSVPSFHHDIASKLQSLIMTLEEIGELIDSPGSAGVRSTPEQGVRRWIDRSDVRNLVTTAGDTIRELSKLLTTNRSLVRPSRPKRYSLSKLVGLAAERSGVRVHTTVPNVDLNFDLWPATHALALILDLAAGPTQWGRTVDITVVPKTTFVVLEVTGPAAALHPLPSNFNEVITLASFAFAREAGQLRCGRDRFTIRLPLAS